MADVEAERQRGRGSRCSRRAAPRVRPTVATRPSWSRATASTAHTNSAAAHRASRRSPIGTVPAWPASPVNAITGPALPGDRADDAERDAGGFEHRTLLDVDLEVADQVAGLAAGAGAVALGRRRRRAPPRPTARRPRRAVPASGGRNSRRRRCCPGSRCRSGRLPRRRTRAPRRVWQRPLLIAQSLERRRSRRAPRACRRSGRRRGPCRGASRPAASGHRRRRDGRSRLPIASRRTAMPAASIHSRTLSPACQSAGVANRRVKRPGSSLKAASSSHRASTAAA